MSAPLRIEATGMCCAVGHNTAAASAAVGACVDHFRQSWFRTRRGAPLPCAMVWGMDAWGPERMGTLFHSVLAQCQEQTSIIPEETALMLLVADPARPGADQLWPQEIYEHCVGQRRFHDSSRICPWDRGGMGAGLLHARELLSAGTVRKVLLAGVDSYLNAVTINAYLEEELLLTDDVTDGFIPGEGAGAVVLTLAKPGDKGVHVAGVGVGLEQGHLRHKEKVNRADGLVAAVRAAVQDSGRPLTDMDFQMADNNGLDFYARERAMMLMRTLEHKVEDFPLILPATYWGDVGAAVGPLMLAYAETYMSRHQWRYGLLHSSSDMGQCSAVLLHCNQ